MAFYCTLVHSFICHHYVFRLDQQFFTVWMSSRRWKKNKGVKGAILKGKPFHLIVISQHWGNRSQKDGRQKFPFPPNDVIRLSHPEKNVCSRQDINYSSNKLDLHMVSKCTWPYCVPSSCLAAQRSPPAVEVRKFFSNTVKTCFSPKKWQLCIKMK